MVGARRVALEAAWLGMATAASLVVAGEVVYRTAYHRWLPWAQVRPGRISWLEIVDPADRRHVLGFYSSQLRTTYFKMPAYRDGRPIAYDTASFANEETPAELRRAIECGLEFGDYARIGWPARYASCFTAGDPPDVLTEPGYWNPLTVSSGLWSFGDIHVATRPVLPGFLGVIAACEGLVLGARGGAWLLLGGRQRKRRRRGLCGRCGYELDGIRSGVCPECGGAVKG